MKNSNPMRLQMKRLYDARDKTYECVLIDEKGVEVGKKTRCTHGQESQVLQILLDEIYAPIQPTKALFSAIGLEEGNLEGLKEWAQGVSYEKCVLHIKDKEGIDNPYAVCHYLKGGE